MSEPTKISVVVADFAGTLSDQKKRARPTGEFIVQLLRGGFGVRIPDPKAFAELFDLSLKESYEESLPDSVANLLRDVARHFGIKLPPMDDLLDRMWTDLGDHPIPRENVGAMHRIQSSGRRVGVATNTCRPPERRIQTLKSAGLDDVFTVISTAIEKAKPDAAFYAAVIQAAGVKPGEILFVGDNLHRDVTCPRLAGMKAAHVKHGRPADRPPERMANGTLVLSHFWDLTQDHLDTWPRAA